MVISLFRCSWNRRVAVTASPASTFLRMTFADITAIVAMAPSTNTATDSDTRISTSVKPPRRAPGRR